MEKNIINGNVTTDSNNTNVTGNASNDANNTTDAANTASANTAGTNTPDEANVPVRTRSFDEAMHLHADTNPPVKELFANAYANGNTKVIPDTALRKIWPAASVVSNEQHDDQLIKYLANVNFLHHYALKAWETANDKTASAEWETKGMTTFGAILDMVQCDYRRARSDWLYLTSRATIDAKESKENVHKVIKHVAPNAFRKRVEMLIGMAISGFVFAAPQSQGEVTMSRKLKKSMGIESIKAEQDELTGDFIKANVVTTQQAREAKKAEKAAMQEAEKAKEKEKPAPSTALEVNTTAAKPKSKKKNPADEVKDAAPQANANDEDTLPKWNEAAIA